MELIFYILVVVVLVGILITGAKKLHRKHDTKSKILVAVWITFGVVVILCAACFMAINYSLSHAKSMSQEEWDQLDSAYMALHPDTTVTDTTSVTSTHGAASTSTTSDVETLEVKIK